jgi:hypothetical protein
VEGGAYSSGEVLTGFEWMSGEELRSGHFSTAFALHLVKLECARATGDENASGGGGKDFAGGTTGAWERLGLPDFEECGFVGSRERGIGAWPGDESADFIPEDLGWGGPV